MNSPIADDNTTKPGLDFIRTIVAHDLDTNKHQGRVVTRFPPEPNGYLHIGHAKSICLNFGIAKENQNGVCHLRFDDTNPVTEDTEFIHSIQEDVRWLGFDWQDNLFFASGYFEKLYDLACHLIRADKAYVCHLNEEEIREYRGTVTEAGRPSPYRDRSIEENLALLQKMRAGDFEDGECVLRAKIDMAAANMKMRDPLIYRIRKAHHHRTGDQWCIYPMYDFAHCLSDSIEGITHSICTLEFENNRELYDWFIQETGVECQPQQIEFARLNITYTVMSKRKLLQLVKEKVGKGWDDPRMPTIAGMRRRGYTPEAIRDFCERIGVAKANSTVDVGLLEYSLRDDLNHRSPRVMAVLEPLKVVLTNYPEQQLEDLEASYWPHDVPKEGSRTVPFGKELYIERSDFQETPEKKFFRLAPGKEVRLRYGYVIRCDEVVKNDAGEVVELRCSYDAETLGKAPAGRKVKGTIHWVSAAHALRAEVRIYDRLFSVEKPDAEEGDFKQYLNPESLQIIEGALVEPSLRDCAAGDRFQFERQGYFIADAVDSQAGALVFNRIVPLKDSWEKAKTQVPPVQEAVAKSSPSKAPTTKSPKQDKGDLRNEARKNNPTLQAKFERYQGELGLSEYDADILSGSVELGTFFEAALFGKNPPKLVANWIVNELMREIKDQPIEELSFGGDKLGELVALIADETISGKIGKAVFAELLSSGESPRAIVEAKGLRQISDPAELQTMIDSVLAANQDMVQQYREGQTRRFGFLVGQVLKASAGKANPALVNSLLKKTLDG